MQYFGATDCGLSRSNNQDSFSIDIAGNLLIATVCDGMGGANGGNVASTLAVESFNLKLRKYINAALSFVYLGDIPEFGKPCDDFPELCISDFIKKAVDFSNAEVFSKSVSEPELEGMGTTLTSCIVTPKGIVTVNIGDSRIYYINGGKINKLTKDHSYVQSLIDSGTITEDEAMTHPKRNIILKALGIEPNVIADISYFDFSEGYILLCSDGLSGYFDESFFVDIIENEKMTCEEKTGKLIDFANQKGGADNITAIVIRL